MARLFRRGLRSAVVGAAGAAVAYLFDPDRGRARRARLKDQLQARLRRQRRDAERTARYVAGQVEGAAASARGDGTPSPVDDVEVVQAVRQRLAGLPFPTSDVTIEAVDGVVTLRGQVDAEDQKAQVEAEIRSTPGVREVRSWLHLPGVPAPNKASALQAS